MKWYFINCLSGVRRGGKYCQKTLTGGQLQQCWTTIASIIINLSDILLRYLTGTNDSKWRFVIIYAVPLLLQPQWGTYSSRFIKYYVYYQVHCTYFCIILYSIRLCSCLISYKEFIYVEYPGEGYRFFFLRFMHYR